MGAGNSRRERNSPHGRAGRSLNNDELSTYLKEDEESEEKSSDGNVRQPYPNTEKVDHGRARRSLNNDELSTHLKEDEESEEKSSDGNVRQPYPNTEKVEERNDDDDKEQDKEEKEKGNEETRIEEVEGESTDKEHFYDIILTCRFRDLCSTPTEEESSNSAKPTKSNEEPSTTAGPATASEESSASAETTKADEKRSTSAELTKTGEDSSFTEANTDQTAKTDLNSETVASGSPVRQFWKLQVEKGPGDKTELSEWAGHVVGILGQYNRGKTWVMGRLSGYQFPKEGMTFRTDGMSFKWIKTTKKTASSGKEDHRWHLLIDTAGFNTPITLGQHESPAVRKEQRMKRSAERKEGSKSGKNVYSYLDTAVDQQKCKKDGKESKLLMDKANRRMREEDDYENFLASMTLSLSNYLILVLSETTLQEQRFLFDVVRKWYDIQSSPEQSKCKDIFVVHNFISTVSDEEREELFSQSTEDVYEGRMTTEGGVEVFSCPDLNTRHISLMNNNTEVGKEYNDRAFDVLKNWIHTVLSAPASPNTPYTMAVEFAQSASLLLKKRGYLSNLEKIKLTKRGEDFIYCPEKANPDRPIEMGRTAAEKFYSNIEDFRPAYSIRKYKSKAKSNCKLIQIEAPGVEDIKVKPNFKATVSPGYWVCDVFGSKEKQTSLRVLRDAPELQEYDRLLPALDEEDTEETSADHCRYGKFREQFPIEMTFKKSKVFKVGQKDGIFYIIFEEEEDASDSEDTTE